MIRLDKFLSQAGVASRRQLREIIRAGAVRIDGVCVTDYAYKFDETACTVTVNGETVREAGTLVVMMNKNPKIMAKEAKSTRKWWAPIQAGPIC